MRKYNKILIEIGKWYCTIASWSVTLTLLCIAIFGGKFTVEIHFYTFMELMHTIFKK